MLSQEVKDVARKIGQYYLQKNANMLSLAEDDIRKLEISKIEIVEGKVHITLGRPGLIIGKRGENVLRLDGFLKMSLRIIEDEDPLIEYLIPKKYEEEV